MAKLDGKGMSSPTRSAQSRVIRRKILLETEKSRGGGVSTVNEVRQTPGSRDKRVPRVCLEKKTDFRIPAMKGWVCWWGVRTVVEHVRLGKSEVEQHGLKRDSSRGAVDVDAVKLLGEDARPKDTVKDFMDGSLAVPGSLETALVLKGSGGGVRRDVEEVLVEGRAATDEGHDVIKKGDG